MKTIRLGYIPQGVDGHLSCVELGALIGKQVLSITVEFKDNKFEFEVDDTVDETVVKDKIDDLHFSKNELGNYLRRKKI